MTPSEIDETAPDRTDPVRTGRPEPARSPKTLLSDGFLRVSSFGTNQDEKFLEKCGVLDRPRIKLGGSGDFAQGVALAQITAFMSLDSREPGVWSLSQGESSFLLKGQRMDPESGFRVELLRAIPIPDKDIPLNEILEFKTRRHDEIYALRTEIESFVAEIKASEDKEDTLRDRINRIDIACASVLKICGEWRFPVRLSNIKASFDFKPISTLAGAFGAGAAAQTLSASASYMSAALAGGLLASAPAVKIGGDFGWKGLKARDNPYRYVVQFHRELF